jgi:hypothetical protein
MHPVTLLRQRPRARKEPFTARSEGAASPWHPSPHPAAALKAGQGQIGSALHWGRGDRRCGRLRSGPPAGILQCSASAIANSIPPAQRRWSQHSWANVPPAYFADCHRIVIHIAANRCNLQTKDEKREEKAACSELQQFADSLLLAPTLARFCESVFLAWHHLASMNQPRGPAGSTSAGRTKSKAQDVSVFVSVSLSPLCLAVPAGARGCTEPRRLGV